MTTHLFRMTHYRNVELFLRDGAMFAKNFKLQPQFSISYDHINRRRDNQEFHTPTGENIHHYVPFYFSPATSMAYAISKGIVDLVDTNGANIGKVNNDDIVYMVCNTESLAQTGRSFWFTDRACNKVGANFYNNLNDLNNIKWDLFNDPPLMAQIPEIGYTGAGRLCTSNEKFEKYKNRTAERMAEFMLRDQVSIQRIDCIIVKKQTVAEILEQWIAASVYNLRVIVKSNCYY